MMMGGMRPPGPFPLVSALLDAGADARLQDEDGNTPLHLLLLLSSQGLQRGGDQRAHEYAMKGAVLLLENGSDMNGPPNNDSMTPLNILGEGFGEEAGQGAALTMSAQDVIERQTTFLAACEAGKIKEVQDGLRHGVLAGYQDPDGHTGLYFATQKMHTAVVQVLLENGASANHVTRDGRDETALHVALRRSLRKELQGVKDRENSLRVIALLLESTNYLDRKDGHQKTALEIGLDNNWLAGASLLLKAGANRQLTTGGVNDGVVAACEEALEQHKAAFKKYLKDEAARAEAKKQEEKLDWDKQLCRKSLVNDLKFASKIASEAIDAVGTDVDACVAWIKTKQQRDKETREEKERHRKEKKAQNESDEEENSDSDSDGSESSLDGRVGVWDSSNEESDEEEDMPTGSAALTRAASMVPTMASSLMEERQAKIIEAQKVLCVNTTVVANLLPHFKWKPDNLVRAWYSNREKVLADARIEITDEDPLKLEPGSECMLWAAESCTGYMEDSSNVDKNPNKYLTALKCGHVICNGCWGDFLTSKIKENDIMMLRCPVCVGGSSDTLSPAVPEDMVKRLVSPETYAKFQHFVTSNYVSTQPSVKWCPHPSCGFVVNAINSTRVQAASMCKMVHPEKEANKEVASNLCIEAECGAGHRFCFLCMCDSHAPVTCCNVKDWEQRNSDEGGNETNTWILANTRPCPGCAMRLEKNAGCSHMKCGTHAHGGKMAAGHGCGLDFCWECMTPNAQHDYATCGQKARDYNKSEIEAKSDGKEAELVRYLSSWKQWKTQQDERKWMVDETPAIQKKMQEMRIKSRDPNTLSIVDTVGDACKKVLQCRSALAWCEVHFFYCEKGTNEFALFENYMITLKKVVLNLVMQLQKPWEDMELASLTDSLKIAERVFATI